MKFFGVRKSKGYVPKYGHMMFIFACAKLAEQKLYISDIHITVGELDDALKEASDGKFMSPWGPRNGVVNAKQILQLKKELGL